MIQLHWALQSARMEISSHAAVLAMKSPAAKFSITTEAPKLEIHQPAGILEIDGTAMRASLGLKTPTQFALDNAAAGRQTAMETIARIAQNGDRMAHIESGENAVVEIAADEAAAKPAEITLAPLEPPEIHYTMRKPEFSFASGKVYIQAEPSPVEMQYTPGDVELRMTQYASIRFWTTGSQIDKNV